MNMVKFLSVFVLSICFLSLEAQFPGAGGARGSAGGAQNTNIGHFYGKIVDSKTNKGVEGVTVQIRDRKSVV